MRKFWWKKGLENGELTQVGAWTCTELPEKDYAEPICPHVIDYQNTR